MARGRRVSAYSGLAYKIKKKKKNAERNFQNACSGAMYPLARFEWRETRDEEFRCAARAVPRDVVERRTLSSATVGLIIQRPLREDFVM